MAERIKYYGQVLAPALDKYNDVSNPVFRGIVTNLVNLNNLMVEGRLTVAEFSEISNMIASYESYIRKIYFYNDYLAPITRYLPSANALLVIAAVVALTSVGIDYINTF
jgi:hypothetical protein